MKKTLLLMGLGAFICSASVSAAPRKNSGKEPSKLAIAQKEANKINKRNAESKEIWRAGTETYFAFYGGWEEGASYTCSYYPNGFVKEKVSTDEYGYTYGQTYEYDDLGRIVKEANYSSYNGGEIVEDYSKTYVYDSIIKNLVVFTEEKYGEVGYGRGILITRNDLGNITKVQAYSIYGDEMENSGDFVIVEYGDDNIANKIYSGYAGTDWSTGEPYEEVYTTASNIVWESTDGQIYELNLGDIDLYDPSNNLSYAANKIKSCTVVDSQWPVPVEFTAEYDGLNYHTLLTLPESINVTHDNRLSEVYYTRIDENDSYKATVYKVDIDDDDEGNLVFDEAQETMFSYIEDAYGIVIEDLETYVKEGGEAQTYGSMGEVAYDEVYGYPLEYISKYMYNGEWQEYMKIVYSDYINVAETVGIQAVESSSADAPVEYFNLNGMRVSNPTGGIFIRRQGNKVSKVVVK